MWMLKMSDTCLLMYDISDKLIFLLLHVIFFDVELGQVPLDHPE
jgi:hypothetical protein